MLTLIEEEGSMGLPNFGNTRPGPNAMPFTPEACLAMEGLAAAFAALMRDLYQHSGVNSRVFLCGRERQLEPEICAEVYRIGCEAIVNAYRHSGSRQIETEVEYRSTELRIVVRDTGCGIDTGKLQSRGKECRGLREMRERAGRIGAELSIFSKVGAGTEVELRVHGQVAFQ